MPSPPRCYRRGLLAIIGKGDRGEAVKRAIVANGAVYFTAPAGCAASLSACVESVEVVAYEDLGTESIKRLTVNDLPLVVAIDCRGNDIYDAGPEGLSVRKLIERRLKHRLHPRGRFRVRVSWNGIPRAS